MITDEERREAAANIRSAANRRKDDLNDDPDYSPFAALYCVFCGVRGWPHYEDLLHLADLIDHGVCYNVYDESEYGACTNGFECSVCGCRVEDEEHYHVSGVWNFCPQCGKRVRPKNE